MNLISWNVNGLRACVKKGFIESFKTLNPDIICLQEIKMQKEQANFTFEGYTEIWNSAERKGYSGTAIFTKVEPLTVNFGMGIDEHDHEGRVVTAEYEKFFLVCCYTPNSKRELLRLSYRMNWEDDFKEYLLKLNKTKPVILCGDLNVAHEEIDIKNPKTNKRNPGFTDEERNKMTDLLSSGFTDTFRYKFPNKEDAYTWWSPMAKARERNVGWRIDYFLVSNSIKDKFESAVIHDDVFGSDHCPIGLIFDEKKF